MAIYHLSVKTVSRSAGRSATASAAYRSGVAIFCERRGDLHDYTRRSGVESIEMTLPRGAPSWANNRAELWNTVEQHETRKNSTVAREFEVSLPDGLNPTQRRELVREFANELAARHGVAVDAAIHTPSRAGDDRNYHAHILTSTRRLGPDGFGEKVRELDSQIVGPKEVERWRERWAQLTNKVLEQAGHSARVDHRSLVAQRRAALESGDTDKAEVLDREPSRHLGPVPSDDLRRFVLGKKPELATDRAREHLEIVADNHERQSLLRQLREVVAWGIDQPEPQALELARRWAGKRMERAESEAKIDLVATARPELEAMPETALEPGLESAAEPEPVEQKPEPELESAAESAEPEPEAVEPEPEPELEAMESAAESAEPEPELESAAESAERVPEPAAAAEPDLTPTQQETHERERSPQNYPEGARARAPSSLPNMPRLPTRNSVFGKNPRRICDGHSIFDKQVRRTSAKSDASDGKNTLQTSAHVHLRKQTEKHHARLHRARVQGSSSTSTVVETAAAELEAMRPEPDQDVRLERAEPELEAMRAPAEPAEPEPELEAMPEPAAEKGMFAALRAQFRRIISIFGAKPIGDKPAMQVPESAAEPALERAIVPAPELEAMRVPAAELELEWGETALERAIAPAPEPAVELEAIRVPAEPELTLERGETAEPRLTAQAAATRLTGLEAATRRRPVDDDNDNDLGQKM